MENAKLVKYGYIVSFSSVLILPVPMAIAGIVIAVMNIKRGEVKHGRAQIIIASVCGLIGAYVGSVLYKYFLAR